MSKFLTRTVTYVFIGLLVISFAIWGIQDWITGAAQQPVAEVAGEEITQAEFYQVHQRQMQAMQQQLRRAITPADAKALGIDRRVLSRIVGTRAINAHARELNLGISDKAVIEQIQNNDAFKSVSGKFSNQILQETLRSNGTSESEFVRRQKEDRMRNQITDAMMTEIVIPDTMINLLNQHADERRKISYFVVGPDKVGEVKEPDEAALKKYYDGNKREFTTPTMRKLGLLILDPAELIEKMKVSDEDAKKYYDANRGTYDQLERRTYQSISFKDKATAEKALKAIKDGKSFVDAAKEAGFTEKEIDQGDVKKSQITDPKVRDVVFKLEKDKASDPVEGRLSTVLLRVTKITPEVLSSFEGSKDRVIAALKRSRVNRSINDIVENVENERGGGATLQEAAKQLNLKYTEIAAVDRAGKGPDGKPVSEITSFTPDRNKVLAAAFGSEAGDEVDRVDLEQNGQVWIDIADIIPEQLKKFETVKDDVKKAYIASEKSTALAKLAKDYVTKVNKGTDIAAVAKEAGIDLTTTDPIRRNQSPGELPTGAVQQAFSLPAKRGSSASHTDEKKGVVVFQVTEIKTPDAPTEEVKKRIRTTLERQVVNNLLAEYIGGLQTKYNVTVNQKALDQAVSGQGGGRGSGL